MESSIALFHYKNYLEEKGMSTEMLSFVKDLFLMNFSSSQLAHEFYVLRKLILYS